VIAMARHFATVEEVERAHGPLPARDREIAYLYLDLGLTAAECGRRVFASESAVLRRLAVCGIARRPTGGSGPRLDARVFERTAFLYDRLGLSLAAVARLEGVHPNAVRHRLRAAGVAVRPPGGRTRNAFAITMLRRTGAPTSPAARRA
jgi:hypothetical protein